MERRLHKCSSTVLQGNDASIKMHKKLGYEQEGILKENIYLNGSYYDEVCFGLTIDKYLENISNKKIVNLKLIHSLLIHRLISG